MSETKYFIENNNIEELEINKQIALLLVKAQMASNRGHKKESEILIAEKYNNRSEGINKSFGYYAKLIFQRCALELISKNETQFSYFVTRELDQKGRDSILSFFEFVGSDGEIHQMSFHCPANNGECLSPYIGTTSPKKWNGVVGGSISSAIELVNMYELGGD